MTLSTLKNEIVADAANHLGSDMTVAVYTDSVFFEQRFLYKLKIPDDYQLCHSQHEYVSATADIKLAFTTDRCRVDYDIGDPVRLKQNRTNFSLPGPLQGFEEKLARLSQASDMVFTFDSEIHDSHCDIWSHCRFENVYWVAPGFANADDFINQRIIHWPSFFDMQKLVYEQLPEKLDELKYSFPKPLYFDALLGRKRPHRDFVHTAISGSDIKDKIIMTYFGLKQEHKPTYAVFGEDFIWETGTSPLNATVTGTHENAVYFGTNAGISRIIPIDVFNKTAYSIVAETNFDNRITFYTEKIVKPIMARRLFVVFSGARFLENLRKLGYQTFGNVIDESYDLIEDNETRWQAAFDQVKLLCQLDQAEVFDQIKDTLEYNYNLLMSANGDQQVVDLIQQKLNTIL